VDFDWDEAKRHTNIHKHGIDFVDVPDVFAGMTVTIEDTRLDYGEIRFVTLGLLKGRTVVVVHTEEAKTIRIISARKATRYEEKNYFDQIAD
jgi:uncharacterized DUF497 family protein